MMTKDAFLWAGAFAVLACGALPYAALAEDEDVEELVIVGTRAQPRSVLDSTVPIDVISGENLVEQGFSDMHFMLRTVVPSFTVNTQPGRDASALQNPINLRGLASDHVLVLVNGKRRHRGASITWLSDGRSDGAQGPDISVIPGIALKQVEVLRDGAAAQYGSDAIAGVLNFTLKDDAEGAQLEAQYGWYTEDGDEDKTRVSGNVGLPLTDYGFANFSFEYSSESPTDRSILRDDVRRMIEGGNTHIADPAHVWGSPDIDDNFKTFFNLGVDLDADLRVYAFGNYAKREVETGFFYREPEDEAGVFAVNINEDLMAPPEYSALLYDSHPGADPRARVGGGGSSDCIGFILPLEASGLPPDLDGLLADDDCFSFHEWFPGGYQPRFGADVTDYSLVVGMKGAASIGSGLSYDISASIGENDADYFIYNTVNPSWGPDSPTSFDPGDYTQTETNFNLDLGYRADIGLHSELSIAGGFEWREEEFEITRGDDASWRPGAFAGNGSRNGSHGFGGFSDTAAGTWDRENIALYLDLEADVVENWTLGGAVRWEDFDDFGTTTNFKLSTRIQVSDLLALRASVGTGFHAPTPGQQNAFNISTIFDTTTSELVQTGTVPSDSALAREFGGVPLEPEESDSFSVGAVLEVGDLSLTVDYFRTDVEDRIFLSDAQTLSDEQAAEFGFSSIRFFENDFDTKTDGVDVVLTYSLVSEWGDTDFLLSYNHTETEVTKFQNLSEDRRLWIERGVPENRYSFSAHHATGDWRMLLRYNYFGSWYSGYDSSPSAGRFVEYGSEGLIDLAVTRKFGGLSLVVGADNVFDNNPDRSVGGPGRGNKYPRFAPSGIDGRFAYARVAYEF